MQINENDNYVSRTLPPGSAAALALPAFYRSYNVDEYSFKLYYSFLPGCLVEQVPLPSKPPRI